MNKIILIIMSVFIGSTTFAQGKANETAEVNKKQKTIKVEITEKGFMPSTIKAQKGDNLVLLVTRKTDKTCVTELKNINSTGETKLPLNQETPFKVGMLNKTGDIKILCGMAMSAGVISVL